MKKTTTIISLAIGLVILINSNLMANNPTMSKEVIKTDISIEKEIHVQDWMLSVEKTTLTAEQAIEKEIRLESWMISPGWNDNSDQMTSETEIELEDWMTRSFLEENMAVAQFVPVI